MDEFKSKIKDESIWKELTHLRKYSLPKRTLTELYGQMV